MKSIIPFIIIFSIHFSLRAQRPVSQIEGYLEVYMSSDTFSTYIGKSVARKINPTFNLYNTFAGSNAGFSNTEGNYNSFFGNHSGYSNTLGRSNSFFGNHSGYSNTTGMDNSFFGEFSGTSNYTGDHNSFFGRNSGRDNTEGGYNSFFGSSTGKSNSIGIENSFFGAFSGIENTDGFYNSYFGSQSGYSNSQGSRNSFFGKQSGYSNTIGSCNTFFGEKSGYTNTDGNYNTFLGNESGYSNTNGSYNTFIGAYSGKSINSGILNSFFGLNAGKNVIEGSNNLILGSGAGPNLPNSVIYQRLYLDIEPSSTPLIYGEFDNDLIRINGKLNTTGDANFDANVGIGTGTPTKGKLEIAGFLTNSIAEKAYYFVNLATDMADFGHSGPGGYSDYSIYASHGIAAHVFHAFSDQRIKKDIIPSDNKTDLNTLMQIEVDDYSHIDQVKNGPNKRKGMIAQQVESVFPEAIGKSTEIVPSIHSLSTSIQRSGNEWVINISKAHDLKKGDIVRLITRNLEEKELIVTTVSDDQSFRIEAWSDKIPEDLFIYGKQVDDFRTIDYDRIFILGVSAIQELNHKMIDQDKTIEKQNERIVRLEAIIVTQTSRADGSN